jgi:hypothetical protein
MVTRRIRLGWQVLVCLLVIASGPAQAQTTKPDALLAVDQNRATVIERIVNSWGDQLALEAGLSRAQLREMLAAMRADQLLAASLAGSLSGLHAVMTQALPATAPARAPEKVHIEALGDTTQDLVYTPVNPCRLFDTRASQGGLGTPVLNTRRTYGAITPVANQGGPGSCAAAASAGVALIQIGTLTPSGSGLLQGGAQGAASFPNALILYQPGDQYGTAVAMPLNPANGQFDLVEQFATADLYGDLLGYFGPPAATALDCTTLLSQVSLPHASTGEVALDCTAGYQVAGGGCVFYNTDGTATASNVGSVILNYSTRHRTGGTFLNGWACRFTNTDPTIDYFMSARPMCCRTPGH